MAFLALSIFTGSYILFSRDEVDLSEITGDAETEQSSGPSVDEADDLNNRRSLSELFAIPSDNRKKIRIQRGDNIEKILVRAGAKSDEAKEIGEAARKVMDSASLKSGQRAEIVTEFNPVARPYIRELNVKLATNKELIIKRDNSGNLLAEMNVVPVEKELYYASSVIKGSLFETAVKMNIPFSKMNDLVQAYSYDIDFQRQIKAGDKFSIIIERMQNAKGEVVGYGNILYSSLVLSGDNNELYYHVAADGDGEYYDAKGNSIKKALLKTPINAAKITSGFGMRRHPVLGYSKMHRGVDFAAPTGTPILAAGDGKVVFMGRKGGYGNYLKIAHNSDFSTAYAHISRFADGIRNGAKVKQGQVIAYVGTTGMSTGPHLHFEVVQGGEQVNPLKVKMDAGNKLSGKELAEFKARKAAVDSYVASIAKDSNVASNSR